MSHNPAYYMGLSYLKLDTVKNSAVLIIVNSLVISAKSKPHFWYLDKVFHVKLLYFINSPFIVHVQTAQDIYLNLRIFIKV